MKDPDGKLTIWSSTQAPHYVHLALAKVLEMPWLIFASLPRRTVEDLEGKTDPFRHEMIVAKAALLLDRPVKICLTREEVFDCHRGRHPVLMKFKTGVKKNGPITAMNFRPCWTVGPTDPTVWPALSIWARCKPRPPLPRYRFQGLPHLHQ